MLSVLVGAMSRDELLDQHVFNLGGDVVVARNLDRAYSSISLEGVDCECGRAWLIWGHDWDGLPYALGVYRTFVLRGAVQYSAGTCGWDRIQTGARGIQVRYLVDGASRLHIETLEQ